MGGFSDVLLARGRDALERLLGNRRAPSGQLDPGLRREVVLFLRDWLPEPVQEAYREMILAAPEEWHRDPHFEGGVVVRHVLRGNGVTEAALGVDSLDRIWPELLREAVLSDGEAGGERASEAAGEERA